jgi:hypothetical protein
MKYVFFALLIVLFSSCDTNEECEAFNFKRIPFNRNYYLHNLNYTNGNDTIELFPKVEDCSKKSHINPVSNPDCSTVFSISYDSKTRSKLSILYSFEYYPQDKFTTMSIILNSSEISFNIKPHSEDSFFQVKNIEHLNERDSSKMIKNIFVKKMNIYSFETMLGEKWRLLNR